MQASLRVLRDGGAVGIYPEGTRGAGDLELFHRGAAYLAMVTGAPSCRWSSSAPACPAATPSSLPPRGSRIDVVFGEPVSVDTAPWPRTKKQVGDASRLLRERMLADLDDAAASHRP